MRSFVSSHSATFLTIEQVVNLRVLLIMNTVFVVKTSFIMGLPEIYQYQYLTPRCVREAAFLSIICSER